VLYDFPVKEMKEKDAIKEAKSCRETTPFQATSVQLARRLGLFEATMIGVGAMIGAGIFVLTGIAVGNSGPAAVIAFGLNGVVTLFTALSYAELASAIPEAGGGYSYIKKVMPNSIAFMSGWMLWFAYIVACSLYAKGFGSYFLEFFERYVPSVAQSILGLLGEAPSVAFLAVLIGILFLTINIIGTHATGKTENVITMTKIVILSVFVFFGAKQVLSAPNVAKTNFNPLFPLGFSGVLAAMGLTFIAFEGYDLIATISEEVKEPRRTIPRAILLSLAITIVIYLLVVFSCIGAVPSAEGLPTWQLLGRYKEIGIIRAAQGFMPKFGVILILGGGLFATLSALNATIMASSRVAFSMGRDWMLPNLLSRVHSIRRTPVLAISLSGFLFLAVAVALPLEIIGISSSLLFLMTFALVNVALIMYRRRSTSPQTAFRVPFFPLTPLLGVVTSAGLAVFQLVNNPLALVLAAAWVLVGLAVFAILFSKRVSIADVPKTIETPELLDLKKTKRYKTLVPLANPERVRPLVELAGKIACTCKGEVLALSVVDLPSVIGYSVDNSFVNEAQMVLSKAQEIAIEKRLPFSSLLKIGRSASSEIIQVAKENRCHLILLGYKKDEDPLDNSVIHHVISHQPCDVAILKSGNVSAETFQRILIPLAGREVHDKIKVRIVHCLYQTENNHITLMTVIPPGSSMIRRSRGYEMLKRAAKVYRISQAELVVDENEHPAQAIINRASACDLLVLGMRDEPWLRAFFFGTLAQQVAGQVQCSTILTKAFIPQRAKIKRLIGRGPHLTRDIKVPTMNDDSYKETSP
jgi:amino acid transporter/nucleotide-binding universal stress UspA family protein